MTVIRREEALSNGMDRKAPNLPPYSWRARSPVAPRFHPPTPITSPPPQAP
jgi:hypothetical protein